MIDLLEQLHSALQSLRARAMARHVRRAYPGDWLAAATSGYRPCTRLRVGGVRLEAVRVCGAWHVSARCGDVNLASQAPGLADSFADLLAALDRDAAQRAEWAAKIDPNEMMQTYREPHEEMAADAARAALVLREMGVKL